MDSDSCDSQTSFVDIAEFIEDASTFAVCGHINPDGDSIGSTLGLVAALRQAGKEATPLLANGAPAPVKYGFLLGHDEFVRASDYEQTPDVFISVDTPSQDRMGESYAVMLRAAKRVSLDHHPGQGIGADMTLVDTSAASASMLVWKLACAMLGEPNAFVAAACYTGVLTDTGRFQFQNTDGEAFGCAAQMVDAGADPARIATEVYQTRPIGAVRLEGRLISRITTTPGGLVAIGWVDSRDYVELGASLEDTEGLVDTLRAIDGAEVALLVRGRENGVRCSIRAKHEMDVSAIAKHFGGGGHKAAAGFNLDGTLPDVLPQIQEFMTQVECQIQDGTYPMGL